MNKLNQEYWFYIDNYVHISQKKDLLLLYNPLTGKLLEYYKCNREIIKLVKHLHSEKNLLVILLSDRELKKPAIAQFVRDVQVYFMGGLMDVSCSEGKPVQLMPMVNILRDVEKIKKDAFRSVGEGMMRYLNEISLYVNDECHLDCDICGGGYKQFLCCTKRQTQNRELDILDVKKIFKQTVASSLLNINILGGNILRYSKLTELTTILKEYSFEKTFYLHYKHLISDSEKVRLLVFDNTILKILVDFPVRESHLKQVLELISPSGVECEFHFVIQDAWAFEQTSRITSLFKVGHYKYKPYYNGRNRDFFENNIFICKENLVESRPTNRDIDTRQVINAIDFGHLTIMSNGDIYANVNAPPLGILDRDSMYDVVYKEMENGESWRRVRKKIKPCKSCGFEALCPPLSNYEYAIGQNNLCRINVSHKT